MLTSALPSRIRAASFGALAVALVAAASAPGAVRAGARSSVNSNRESRETRHAGPVTVALGTSGVDAHARELLAHALTEAVEQSAALRLSSYGRQDASLVLNANVRTLAVQQDAAGVLARCELSVVISDGSGAVRATLDTRRVVRASAAESAEWTALRGAADGVVRDVVSQMVR